MAISTVGDVSMSRDLSVTRNVQAVSVRSDSVRATHVFSDIRTSLMPTAATNFSGLCEIIIQGSVHGGGSLTAGVVYQLVDDANNSGDMSWKLANASNSSTTNGLLAVALGTSPTDGMLLRGVVIIESNLFPNSIPGATVYLRDNNGGMTTTAPTGSGDSQRILGHYLVTTQTHSDHMIHFNPSQEFITIA